MAIDFEAEAAELDAVPVTAEQLQQISTLAYLSLRIERDIAALNDQLEKKQAELRKVQTDLLPAAMKQARMQDFTLDNGARVEVSDEVYASITEANEPKAFSWLESTNNGSIIKEEFKVVFGAGEGKRARQFEVTLQKIGITDYSQKRGVHHSTLKAFVKAELERGSESTLPRDAFGVFQQRVAKVLLPNSKPSRKAKGKR